MKPTPGLCDRCGQRYPLSELKLEYVLGKSTGLRTCRDCHDYSHPQLDTRNVRTDDKQSVDNSRPETVDSRRMSAYNPVGGGNSSTYLKTAVGRITIA